MPDKKIYNLIEAYLQGRLSATEKEELEMLLANHLYEDEIVEALAKYLDSLQPDTSIDKQTLQHIWQNAVAIDKDQQPAKIRSLKPWLKWVAAASVIIIAALLVTLSLTKGRPGTEQPTAITHDVQAPSNTRAVITLADGSKVYLDSASNGTIAKENNVNVVKGDSGQISYSLSAKGNQGTANSLSYNTLFNPRGSKVISLTLSDGTRAWLNSESSLKYPTAFTSTTREVEITGEAYFEVKHDAKQPFKVHLPNGGVVEDIGTSFNVNSYADESDIKTTLIEGSVRIANGEKRTAVLKPGQQAVLSTTGHSPLTTSSVDVEQVMAWKNGLFQFNKTSIEDIMRQAARWYDVDIVYSGKVVKTFDGEVLRSGNLSELLQILESTGWVHFKIEGKKVIVTP